MAVTAASVIPAACRCPPCLCAPADDGEEGGPHSLVSRRIGDADHAVHPRVDEGSDVARPRREAPPTADGYTPVPPAPALGTQREQRRRRGGIERAPTEAHEPRGRA
jgi:hypothetical protein